MVLEEALLGRRLLRQYALEASKKKPKNVKVLGLFRCQYALW
jgi:hypothetical protein